MGATIGIGVAAAHPETVTGLVMVNPAVPHPRPGLAEWLRMAWLAPLAVPALGTGVVAWRSRTLGAERLVDSSLQASITRAHQLDPDLRRRMVQLTAERLTWPEAPAAYAAAARSLITYLAWGLHRDLRRAATPARGRHREAQRSDHRDHRDSQAYYSRHPQDPAHHRCHRVQEVGRRRAHRRR